MYWSCRGTRSCTVGFSLLCWALEASIVFTWMTEELNSNWRLKNVRVMTGTCEFFWAHFPLRLWRELFWARVRMRKPTRITTPFQVTALVISWPQGANFFWAHFRLSFWSEMFFERVRMRKLTPTTTPFKLPLSLLPDLKATYEIERDTRCNVKRKIA